MGRQGHCRVHLISFSSLGNHSPVLSVTVSENSCSIYFIRVCSCVQQRANSSLCSSIGVENRSLIISRFGNVINHRVNPQSSSQSLSWLVVFITLCSKKHEKGPQERELGRTIGWGPRALVLVLPLLLNSLSPQLYKFPGYQLSHL